jgi:hypothetical protein
MMLVLDGGVAAQLSPDVGRSRRLNSASARYGAAARCLTNVRGPRLESSMVRVGRRTLIDDDAEPLR